MAGKLSITQVGHTYARPEGFVTIVAVDKIRGEVEIQIPADEFRWILASGADMARNGYLGEDLREQYSALA
jgi:hypothetical protein